MPVIRAEPYQWIEPEAIPPRSPEERARWNFPDGMEWTDWTDADDKAHRQFAAMCLREWERRHPVGCEVDRTDYNATWRVLRLYLPPGHQPSMTRTIRWARKHWPRAARIVCKSGKRDCINYARCPRGDEDGFDFGECGWWRAIRPGHCDYVY
jgi:hypothetical protein